MHYKVFALGAVSVFAALSYSSALSSPVAEAYTYSIGTGFFVHSDGYVVTNHHVIQGCRDITVHGAVPDSKATLVAVHKHYDLALLKTVALPMKRAALSSDKQPLIENDRVVIVGYPGQSWEVGAPETREARITSLTGPSGEVHWLAFTDSLQEGNSGGPLLDTAGNVVGVAVAKAKVHRDIPNMKEKRVVDTVDLAVSLPVLRMFLGEAGVTPQQADSGIYKAASSITEDARQYIVNVRCRYI